MHGVLLDSLSGSQYSPNMVYARIAELDTWCSAPTLLGLEPTVRETSTADKEELLPTFAGKSQAVNSSVVPASADCLPALSRLFCHHVLSMTHSKINVLFDPFLFSRECRGTLKELYQSRLLISSGSAPCFSWYTASCRLNLLSNFPEVAQRPQRSSLG